MSSVFVVSSFEDLVEWDGTDTLAFADGDKLAFGAGDDLDLYSDGTIGMISVPTLGLTFDNASGRNEWKLSSFELLPGTASIPMMEFNPNSPFLPGISAFKNVLYLAGASTRNPQLQLINDTASFSAEFTLIQSTSTLQIASSGTLSIVVGDTNDKFSVLGATSQAQKPHIVPADGTLADLTAKFNTLLADLESFGFHATS